MPTQLQVNNLAGSDITGTKTGSSIALDVSITNERSLTSIQSDGNWITTSTTPIDSASLSARKSIAIQNITSGTFYMGGSPLNTGSAWVLRQWDTVAIDLQSGTTIYGQASVGSLDIRTMEVG